MADVLPINFPLPTENLIASYNWTDVVEGTGIVLFYAGGLADDTGINYILNSDVFSCSTTSNTVNQRYRVTSTASASFTKLLDLDFDAPVFNNGVTLGGTMYSEIPFGTHVAATGRGAGYVTIILKKVDSVGTETTICTESSTTLDAATDNYEDVYFSFSQAVPLTNVKAGEKIRVTMEFYGKQISGATCNFFIGHDPRGNEVIGTTVLPSMSAGNTVMTYKIPFKIQQ